MSAKGAVKPSVAQAVKTKHQNTGRCKRMHEDRKQEEIEDKIILQVLHG